MGGRCCGKLAGYVESVGEMLGGQNVLVKLAVIILAVTCGVSMFAYPHNRRKVDFYHSLPISRSRLFAVDYATGALCALVPYCAACAEYCQCMCDGLR